MTINLDTLRETAEAATPGPWVACSERDPDGTRRYTVNPDRELDTDVCAMGYDMPGSANVEFIATFNPETVLELIERAEAAERALDFHSQRDRELKMTLSMISDRLDEHSYDELSSLIEDEPLDQWGELYKSRLEQAEQQVQAVLRLADSWETGALRWEDPLRVPNEVFLLRKALHQPTHEPDWTDYQLGDPGASCSCGYNGPYKECWQSRRALDGDSNE